MMFWGTVKFKQHTRVRWLPQAYDRRSQNPFKEGENGPGSEPWCAYVHAATFGRLYKLTVQFFNAIKIYGMDGWREPSIHAYQENK